jgi:ABC-type uncharacterized transport system permease subunit
MGNPEDLMGAVTFLSSDASAYVTGAYVYLSFRSCLLPPEIRFPSALNQVKLTQSFTVICESTVVTLLHKRLKRCSKLAEFAYIFARGI